VGVTGNGYYAMSVVAAGEAIGEIAGRMFGRPWEELNPSYSN